MEQLTTGAFYHTQISMDQAHNGHFYYSFKTVVPVDIAYTTARDGIYSLAAFLPNIVSIEPVERKTVGDRTYIVNKIQGRSIIPDIIDEIIKVSDLAWLDNNEWLDKEYACNWFYEPFVFKEYIRVNGRTDMSTDGTLTTMRVTGDIHVNFLNYPLVPAGLKDKINDDITKVLRTLIGSNYTALIKGIEQYAVGNRPTVPGRQPPSPGIRPK